MLREIARRFDVDLSGVPVVGDSLRDLQAGVEVGAVPHLVLTGVNEGALVAELAAENTVGSHSYAHAHLTTLDRDAARQRIGAAMESQVAAEADELAGKLGFLATTGSVAPFVGLFGTVWGIMNSFFQIGAQQSASLAVVAPGIAEALFATAIGLFAAIPAVIAYNRFSNSVNQYEAKLQRFADKVHAGLSRELDRA